MKVNHFKIVAILAFALLVSCAPPSSPEVAGAAAQDMSPEVQFIFSTVWFVLMGILLFTFF